MRLLLEGGFYNRANLFEKFDSSEKLSTLKGFYVNENIIMDIFKLAISNLKTRKSEDPLIPLSRFL